MLYCQAILSHSGLGNRLFPWARCRIFSYVNKIPMLKVFWPQIKLGPLLRKESDWQWYHNLFQKRTDEIYGLKKILLLLSAKRLPEPSDFTAPYKFYGNKKDYIILFEGVKNYFEKLNNWNDFLLKELLLITRKRWLSYLENIKSIPIGINVRLGDFKEAKSYQDFFITGSLRTPLIWYIKCLNLIREILGFSAKAFVVSNGRKEELKELLALPDTIFVEHKSAITSLLLLARAKILLGAGGSTFSAWAAFLGQMPVITHPGQNLSWFNLINTKGFFLGTCDPNSPPLEFIQQIKELKGVIKEVSARI